MSPLLKKYHDREDGFTLIELLIVVLIIGILAAIAIPVYLSIQNNAYKSAVRADVNISVKRVQVALTEGSNIAAVKSSASSYTQKSVKGEVVVIGTSPTAGASADDFSLSGILSTAATPVAAPINYTYAYDSVTGRFSEADSGATLPTISITTASLPNGTAGNAYSATVSATAANTTGTTVWTATGLPTGWSINAATGTISAPAGSVSTSSSGAITVTATNGTATDTKNYMLNVYATPVWSTTTLPAAKVGTSYNQTLVANASPAATYTVTAGTLPAGLTLTNAGVLAGTPTAGSGGVANFTVTAQNTAGSTPQAFALTVNETPTVTGSAMSNATINTSYSYTGLSATGYPAPAFNLASGSLPAGVSFSTSTGAISGTPTVSGDYPFTVTATNTAGTSSAVSLDLQVYQTPTITNNTLNDVFIGSGATQNLNVSGYPAGTLSGASGFPSCVLPQTNNTIVESGCTSSNVGPYGVQLQASNAAGTGAASTYLLNVRSTNAADNLNNTFEGGSTQGWVNQSGNPTLNVGAEPLNRGNGLHLTSSSTSTVSARTATTTISGGHTYAFEAYTDLVSGDSTRLCAYRPSDGFTSCSASVTAKNIYSVLGTTITLTGTGTSDFSFYIEVAGSGAKDIWIDDARIMALN